MTAYAYEHADSPEITWAANGKSAKGWRKYVVQGTQDENEALLQALALAPMVIAVGAEVLLRMEGPAKPVGFDTWEVEFNYAPDDDEKNQQKPQPGFWKFAFSTGGHKQKRFYAKKLLWKGQRSPGPSAAAPDTLAINWDRKKVHGVDVPMPQFEFEIEAFYDSKKVTTAFAANLARNTPRMNQNPWLGFEAGELLYLGSDGSGDIPTVTGQRVKPIGIKHKYAHSENLVNIDLASNAPGGFDSGPVPKKRGWDYLSVYFAPVENPQTKLIVPIPEWAWVYQLFDEADFRNLFGFG